MGIILAWITLLPIAGAALVMLVPREEEAIHRGLGFGTALVTFLVSLFILGDFDAAQAGFQLQVDKMWIEPLGIHFHLGIDGISLWLVLLTTFLMPLTLLSPQAIGIRNIRVREFTVAMLVLEAGMLGAFVALDLFVFYVFWELMLIPMYFIIGIWGGERRLYASIKFVIYTLVGSLLMLVAILYLYVQYHAATGSYSFDYVALSHLTLPYTPQMLCFGAFALAFAIKVPIFPLHTWLPDAHVEAPTGGSVILAGVMLKFGTYGFLRFALAAVPARGRAAGAAARDPRGHRHHLRRADGVRAGRRQEAGRVLVGLAPRVRGAGHRDADRGGRAGRDLPDAGARHLDRRPVPRRRLALRPPPHAQARRLRRPVGEDAGVRGLLPGDRARVGRPARPVRLRRRVPGAARQLHRRQDLGPDRHASTTCRAPRRWRSCRRAR